MEIINKKIEELKPYENNPRFNDDAVEYVKNSIDEFGFKVPIVIDEDNTIITGHTRYKASLELGLKKIPCIVVSDLTKKQIKAFRLADNKVGEIATWDFQKLNTELQTIKNININIFDFIEEENIDWDLIEELSNENYEKPVHDMYECPFCNHIDRNTHFKKVK